MTSENKLPAGPFANPQEAEEWAEAAIESFLDACNAIDGDQKRKALTKLVSCCCAHVSLHCGGFMPALVLLEQTHATIAAAANRAMDAMESNPGIGTMQ